MEIKTVENGEYFALKLIRKNYRFAVGGEGEGENACKHIQLHLFYSSKETQVIVRSWNLVV